MPCRALGTLDEWLSQWSAKPCTAVRIRQVPQEHRSCGAFLFIYSMADNYLEKKMEQHKARAVSQAAAKRSNLYSFLEHSVCRGAFDAYAVRKDQLVRIVGAAARTVMPVPFRFRLAVVMRLPLCALAIAKW